MYYLKIFKYILSLGAVATIAVACGNYKSVILKADLSIPDTFATATDTTSVATVPVSHFFADAYLLKLIDTAVKNSPDILSAMQKVEIANADLKYQGGTLLPSVSLNANAGLEKYSDYTMNGVGNYDTNLSSNISKDQHIPNPTPDYFVGFRSSWEIDLWGKLHSRQQAAFNRVLASQNGYRVVITSIAAQIATSYYQLLALDYELKVIRKNISLQNRALEIVKIQKLGARATELAVQQFLAQLRHTQSLEYQTRQQITETENMINFLTGKFPSPVARDTSINILALPNALKTGVPSRVLLNRPDIKQAELELTAMNADIKAARAAFFPSLTLTPYIGFNSFAASLLFNPSSFAYGVIGGITAPIFNRKQIKADYQRTIVQGKIALYNYQKTILGGFMEVTNSMKAMDNYQKYYELKQQEVQALHNAVDVANDLYLVGRASYLEVITAQRNVLEAELSLADTKKNIYLSEVGLYRALGGGWR